MGAVTLPAQIAAGTSAHKRPDIKIHGVPRLLGTRGTVRNTLGRVYESSSQPSSRKDGGASLFDAPERCGPQNRKFHARAKERMLRFDLIKLNIEGLKRNKFHLNPSGSSATTHNAQKARAATAAAAAERVRATALSEMTKETSGPTVTWVGVTVEAGVT